MAQEKMRFYGLRLEPSMKVKIERIAKRDGHGFAEWIRLAIQEKLAQSEKIKRA